MKYFAMHEAIQVGPAAVRHNFILICTKENSLVQIMILLQDFYTSLARFLYQNTTLMPGDINMSVLKWMCDYFGIQKLTVAGMATRIYDMLHPV